jgi:hypothetical protein
MGEEASPPLFGRGWGRDYEANSFKETANVIKKAITNNALMMISMVLRLGQRLFLGPGT